MKISNPHDVQVMANVLRPCLTSTLFGTAIVSGAAERHASDKPLPFLNRNRFYNIIIKFQGGSAASILVTLPSVSGSQHLDYLQTYYPTAL